MLPAFYSQGTSASTPVARWRRQRAARLVVLAVAFTTIGLATVAALFVGERLQPFGVTPAYADSCPPEPQGYDSGGQPAASFPSDPLFGRQWGLTQIKAPQAWARGAKGKGAVIANVDSGVDLGHPDLRANLLPGVNLLESLEGCSRPQDRDGHGTSVSGIAAAVTDNGIGIAGVAPEAKLLPIRATSNDKPPLGLTRGPIDIGIRYAADRGADVIMVQAATNLAPTDDPLDATDDEIAAAIAYAWQKGAVIVAPAVNARQPACSYPAVENLVVCAAATDHLGNPAAYSNLPVKPDLLAVRAPGGFGGVTASCEDDRNVWSTTILGVLGCPIQSHAGYLSGSGTSASAPHVAGVAAMLAGTGLTNVEIIDCIKATSFNPLTGQRGMYDPVYGWGIVDADAATKDCRAA